MSEVTTSSATGSIRSIDTEEFLTLIESSRSLAEDLGTLKYNLNTYKSALIGNWLGKGRNQFEKSYHAMMRKLEDEIDCTWDIYDALVEAEAAYMQADIDAAKAGASLTASTIETGFGGGDKS